MKLQIAKITLLILSFIGSHTALALDVSKCPETLNVIYKGVQRLSPQDLEVKLKDFNNPSGYDYTTRIRGNWSALHGVNEFSVSAKIYRRDNQQSVFQCTYLTGEAGVWVKVMEGVASDRENTYLVVSTPYGASKTQVLKMDATSLVLSQDLLGRQIRNTELVDFGEGSVDVSIEIAAATQILAQ